MTIQALYENDRFALSEIPTDILEAVDFWAENTPNEPFLKLPRGQTAAEGFETATWSEFKQARDRVAPWLASKLGLAVPADLTAPRGQRTITFLLSPTHEVITPWIALASMGYSTQFISPVHQPHVVASLIERAEARAILHGDMDQAWFADVLTELPKTSLKATPTLLELPSEKRLVSLIDSIRGE